MQVFIKLYRADFNNFVQKAVLLFAIGIIPFQINNNVVHNFSCEIKLVNNNIAHFTLFDNNKKIFKYKLLKAKYDNAKYRENKSENLDFMEKLYIFVDESLGNYYKKKYINKLNSEDLNNLIRKDGEINEDYKNWIIENYFETEENQGNSEQN